MASVTYKKPITTIRFAHDRMAYSVTRIDFLTAAKMKRGGDFLKLALLAKKISHV